MTECILLEWTDICTVSQPKPCQLSFLRYDVELFQRIEHLIGKKLPVFPTQEDEVMMLTERVTEAQRFARMVRNLFSHQLKCKQC